MYCGKSSFFHGHSEAVTIEFEKEITAQKAREILENAWGVEVIDDTENYEYPTPRDAAGKNPVYVGRIRKNIAFNNAIDLWCVADNIRIGAALNTVRLAESVIKNAAVLIYRLQIIEYKACYIRLIITQVKQWKHKK